MDDDLKLAINIIKKSVVSTTMVHILNCEIVMVSVDIRQHCLHNGIQTHGKMMSMPM